MRDPQAIAARLIELSPANPGAGLDDLALHVVALGQTSPTTRENALLTEIEELGQAIETMRHEVAKLPVDDIANTHIPCATDELDAIITHTATATETILESCETLDALAGSLADAHSRVVQDMTTRIYEACSFQDITGQRIAKVVTTLQAIESKVGNLRNTFGSRANPPPVQEEVSLLNGPQLPSEAMAQAAIDALLAF